jgi:hypothetical protein
VSSARPGDERSRDAWFQASVLSAPALLFDAERIARAIGAVVWARTGLRPTLMDETGVASFMALTVMAGLVPAIHVVKPHRVSYTVGSPSAKHLDRV